MTTTPKTLILIYAACLVLMLGPGRARSQEPTEPSANPQPAKTTEEPAPPQSGGTLIMPGQGKEGPQETAPGQGAAVTPPAEQPAQEAKTAPAEAETASYAIKKGDTLWDIANAYLKDPFLWPFIWKANPSIANPDLIYPGNTLAIPSLAPIERALGPVEKEVVAQKEVPKTAVVEKKAVAEEPVQPELTTLGTAGIGLARVVKPKSAQPEPGEEISKEQGGLILPEVQPVPVFDKYIMLSAGFVNSDEIGDIVVGSPDPEKTIFSYGNTVYVKFHDAEKVNIGDKYLIYAPEEVVRHPKTDKKFGRLIRGAGILQITAKDTPHVLTALITLSFGEIEKNNMVTPYQEPVLIYPQDKKAKDIAGYVLAVTDRRAISGQAYLVYMDKGSLDGVEPGDWFTVYSEHEDQSFPKKKIGEVQVIIVKDHTATALVRTSTDALEKGNLVYYRK